MTPATSPHLFPLQGLCLGIDPSPQNQGLSSASAALSKELFSELLEQHCLCLNELLQRGLRPPLKPNLGFFLRFGSWGLQRLEEFCETYRGHFPLLLDAKFGEISKTLAAYLDFAFSTLRVDALTLNPFLGESSIEQAVRHCLESTDGKGRVFVLCATSQFGEGPLRELQAFAPIVSACRTITQQLQAEGLTPSSQPLGLVVGANRTDVLNSEALRESNIPLLCPGLGPQGASFAVANEFSQRLPCLFPLSRHIFAGGQNSVEEALSNIETTTQLLEGGQSES